MSPRTLFVRLADTEAVTWTLLLIGMFLKYVTKTTDVGVRVFGLFHGVVFLAYCVVAVAMWINQRWSARVGLLALASAIPPYATIWFVRWARGELDGPWRLGAGGEQPQTLPESVLAWALRRPVLAIVVGVVGVLAATSALLWIGPPGSWQGN
jgi:integral membrane protein